MQGFDQRLVFIVGDIQIGLEPREPIIELARWYVRQDLGRNARAPRC